MGKAFCEKTDLQKAGDMGYGVFRVPGLTITAKGTIVAWYDARMDRGGDWSPIDIMMRRSFDNGITWDEPRVVVDHRTYSGAQPIDNLIMIADLITGELHVLYCHNYERLYYMKSADEAETFSPPVDITAVMETYKDRYNWKVIAPGPGHGIQLRNGRLCIPVWMSTGVSGEFGAHSPIGHRPSDLVSLYSDDHGRTWLPGDFVARTQDGVLHPNETTVVELSDGRVLYNIRHEGSYNRRYISVSPDGAFGWSKPCPDDCLPDPICFGSLVKCACGAAGQTPPILFSNLSSLDKPREARIMYGDVMVRSYDRERLTVRVSFDDCKTWAKTRVLEPGAASYSDIVQAADGNILCVYERGSKTDGRDERYLTVARFNLDGLVEA